MRKRNKDGELPHISTQELRGWIPHISLDDKPQLAVKIFKNTQCCLQYATVFPNGVIKLNLLCRWDERRRGVSLNHTQRHPHHAVR